MATTMEAEVSLTLREMRGVWYTKIPDIPRFAGHTFRAHIPRPFDYIALTRKGTVAIECKQTQSTSRLDLNYVPDHQVKALGHFTSLGGYAYLLVNFRNTKTKPRTNVMFAIEVEQLMYWCYQQDKRHSIPLDWMVENCLEIPRIKLPCGKYGWDLRILSPMRDCDYRRPLDTLL